MSIIDDDCSLDLAEAISLLNLVFFVCEHADNAPDWFTMRQNVHSCAYAAERLLQTALRKVERAPANRNARLA